MNDDRTINGGPPLDCWFGEPDQLRQRLINLMCPRQVCTICGEPRRRITSEPDYVPSATYRGGKLMVDCDSDDSLPRTEKASVFAAGRNEKASLVRSTETLGWSDCGHNTFRRGRVLDPFAGSGTTLQAASELGRDSIGIDLDTRNLELARQRLGMFLVEDDEVVA